MKPAKTVPTDQELEILKVIWQLGPSTVREVFLELQKHRKIAYTTVLTMMGILERKGHLKKSAGDRAYLRGRVAHGIFRPGRGRAHCGRFSGCNRSHQPLRIAPY